MSGTDYTRTLNLGLYKPVYNADAEMWGTHLNDNSDILDTTLSTTPGIGIFQPVNRDVANVKDFGAAGNGTTDDTAAIRAALATNKNVYMPRGVYKITNTLTLTAGYDGSSNLFGQRLFGDNKTMTQIVVGYDFNASATAAITLTGNGYGAPGVENLAIVFQQPSGVTTRANFDTLANGAGTNGKGVKYPPAIDLSLANNGRVADVWIGGAWTGIYANWALSNGETELINVNCGAFYRGLDLTGSQGIVNVNNYHFFPWGIPGGGSNAVYRDGGTYAAYMTNNQGLSVANFFSQYGRLAITGNSVWNPTSISNLQMDGSNATTEISSAPGIVSITGGYATGSATGSDTSAQLQVSAGSVKVTSCDFMGTADSAAPLVALTGGTLMLANSRLAVAATNCKGIVQSGGQLSFTGNVIYVDAASAWTVPLVEITGGTYTITGNSFCPTGGGSGVAISTSIDANWNVVTGNSFGYTWTFVPPGPLGSYVGTSWATWTPTLTASSGTLGSYTASGWYQRVGQTVTVHTKLVLTSIGSASGYLGISLPAGGNAAITPIGVGQDVTTGEILVATPQGGVMYVTKSLAATAIVNGHTLSASASYVAA